MGTPYDELSDPQKALRSARAGARARGDETVESMDGKQITRRSSYDILTGGGHAFPPGRAVPSQPPTVWSDLHPDEQAAVQRRVQAGAEAVVGTYNRKSRGRAVNEEVTQVPDMHMDAVAGRFRELRETADQAAVAHTRATGEMVMPRGFDWYPEHNQDFEAVSNASGIPKDRTIAAGARVSPRNDPKKSELRGVERMADIVSDSTPPVTARVSRAAARHVRTVQTAEKARSSGQKANPVAPPQGEIGNVGDLSSEEIAVLGSVSGAARGTPDVSPELLGKLGLPKDGPKGQRLHPGLDPLRPLGALKGRENVRKAVDILRGDDMLGSHSDPLGNPGKITSYSQTTAQASPEAHVTQDYNWMVEHHGKAGDPFMLPFADTPSSAQDTWQESAALGVTEISRDKPEVDAFRRVSEKKGGEKYGADVSGDDARHAFLNEAQRRSLHGTTTPLSAGQSMTWHAQRDERTAAKDTPFDTPHPTALRIFNQLNEQPEAVTPPPRSRAHSRQPELFGGY